jgi:hypothetical protein
VMSVDTISQHSRTVEYTEAEFDYVVFPYSRLH